MKPASRETGQRDARGVGPSGRYRSRCVVESSWRAARVAAVLRASGGRRNGPQWYARMDDLGVSGRAAWVPAGHVPTAIGCLPACRLGSQQPLGARAVTRDRRSTVPISARKSRWHKMSSSHQAMITQSASAPQCTMTKPAPGCRSVRAGWGRRASAVLVAERVSASSGKPHRR